MNKKNINSRLHLMKIRLKIISKSANNHTPQDLAVVSCYFNPCHYQNRLENYKIFRKGIIKTGVRFLTVELAFGDDPFELTKFPEVMQLRTNKDNIMWQKERLLNIGIDKIINEGYEKVAWLDADIIFEDDAWPEKLSKELNKYPIVQAYDRIEIIKNIKEGTKSFASAVNNYNLTKEFSPIALPGGAWAAKSEVIKQIMLYDKAIIGGGDFLFLFGCYYHGILKKNIENHRIMKPININLKNDFYEWANKTGNLIKGRVSYINTLAKVLYHGNVTNRKYVDRYKILEKYNFNPKKEIKIDKNMVWRWLNPNQRLSMEVEDYFYSREEDN